jgi:hypothetical protein
VSGVEDEWDRDPNVEDTNDLLFVTYDPRVVTPNAMLDLIRKEEFEGVVRSE